MAAVLPRFSRSAICDHGQAVDTPKSYRVGLLDVGYADGVPVTLLDGHLLLPGDAEYARLRRRFVGGDRDELPCAAVACQSEADVGRALSMATAQRAPFAVRSGGHSYADASSTPGLLIDLSELRSIGLDGDLLTVGPGARLGEVQLTLAERGRCLPSASCPSVAVGGSTLS